MVSLLIMISALFFAATFAGIAGAPLILGLAVLVWAALLVTELRSVRPAPIVARAASTRRECIQRSAQTVRAYHRGWNAG